MKNEGIKEKGTRRHWPLLAWKKTLQQPCENRYDGGKISLIFCKTTRTYTLKSRIAAAFFGFNDLCSVLVKWIVRSKFRLSLDNGQA